MNGHRVVGKIAEDHLSRKAANGVRALLGYETLAQAGNWADEIRSDPAWREADPWHYINVHDKESIQAVLDRGGRNVITEIQRFGGVLSSRQASREQQVEALRFLAHFVGDLHQPLHVGRASDRGGNDIQVMWFRQPRNLHAVWDTELFEFEKLSYTEFTAFIDHATPDQIRQWQDTTVLDWAQESLALRDKVYSTGTGNLSYEYARRSLPIVKLRLLQAGIRLAGLLNRAFE